MAATGTVDPNRTHSGEEIAALVTVETAERLARKALQALASDAEPDVRQARVLLYALIEETTRRTCTAVKRQELSDGIAAAARVRVAELAR